MASATEHILMLDRSYDALLDAVCREWTDRAELAAEWDPPENKPHPDAESA